MAYVVRGNNEMIFTSCEMGQNNVKEVEYSSYEEAEKAKNELQASFRDIKLKAIKKQESENKGLVNNI